MKKRKRSIEDCASYIRLRATKKWWLLMTIMVVLRMNNLPNFPKGKYNSGLVLDFCLFMEKVWRVEKQVLGLLLRLIS